VVCEQLQDQVLSALLADINTVADVRMGLTDFDPKPASTGFLWTSPTTGNGRRVVRLRPFPFFNWRPLCLVLRSPRRASPLPASVPPPLRPSPMSCPSKAPAAKRRSSTSPTSAQPPRKSAWACAMRATVAVAALQPG
jgi:hypothetical protein